MKKRIFILFVFIIISLPFIYAYLSDSVKNNIKNGNLQFSKELGWINWKHAIPKGTKVQFKEFQTLNTQSSVDSFSYTYTQTMKVKIVNSFIISESSESRRIKSGLTQKEERLVFFDIFKSVSNSFEKMQAEFPYNLIPASNNSSFREGDLMGNIISFYCSVNNISINDIKNKLTISNTEESLNHYNEQSLIKIKWDDINSKAINQFKGMNYILNWSNNEHHKYSRIINQKEHFYFQNN